MGEGKKSKDAVTVHIGVSRDLQLSIEAGGEGAVKDLAKKLGMKDVTASRLKIFGTITGLADPGKLDNIRQHPGIDFVEADSIKKTL